MVCDIKDNQLRLLKDHSSRRLSESSLNYFHLIFDLFLDFLQKKKFARIVKLRNDQQTLPIALFRNNLVESLSKNQVIVVAGDTGCGKSTQVPQYLHFGKLDGNGQPCGTDYKNIAVTQPRRIACISLAARVSTEMLNEKGSKVGYQVRFERSRTKATQILFLTEGLLLRQMQMDPFLNDYDAIILDEVHERHWQTDCLLGLVKCLVLVRPNLRVVLMSATINVNLFSSFFGNCPVIQVPGRLYPIDLRYMPLTPTEEASSGDRLDSAPYIRLLRHIDATYPVTERGDLLIFVPGMADIQSIMEPAKIYADQTKRWIILPLHSTLSADDQEKVFHVAPDGVRKCVISTNIAETSLTIDGIRFVADSGKVKEISWDFQARMRRLKEFSISKASADQRKGRAGRTGPGVCYRFYSEEDYQAFESFNVPEIRRVPLDTLVLQMMVMGLPDVKKFPFIEPPEPKSLDEALEILKAHGAIKSLKSKDSNENDATSTHLVVTSLGRLLADLPVEFSIGRLLIMASLLGLVEPVLTLASGMAVQSPLSSFTSCSGAEQARRIEALNDYESDHGDTFTVANVFDEWIRMKSEINYLSNNPDDENNESKKRTNTKRWCRQIGAQEQRLHEMVRLRNQFAQLLKDSGILESKNNSQVNHSKHAVHYRNLNRARRTERIKTKRRRLLTLQDNVTEGSESDDKEDEGESDATKLRRWLNNSTEINDISVHDLELILCYNLSDLAESANLQNTMTKADLQLLKVVLAGGLYPKLAIGDSANTYRVANRGGTAGAGAEMVFHTRSKGFVTLNPNDVFVRKPDVLFPESQQTTHKIRNRTEKHKSSKLNNELDPVDLPPGFAYDHQLVMYLDLMETTKSFLVNTIRVPALPTLLLYCREIDTDANLSRIVFDGWLEVRLLDLEASHRAVATIVWLRTTMNRLMELELSECSRRQTEHMIDDSGEFHKVATPLFPKSKSISEILCRKLRRLLGHCLASFLSGKPGGAYSIRRLLAADVKQLYRRQNTSSTEFSDFQASSKIKCRGTSSNKIEPELRIPDSKSGIHLNIEKGGYRVTEYLNIDSLYPENDASDNQEHDLSDSDENINYVDSYNLAVRFYKQLIMASRESANASQSYGTVNSTNENNESLENEKLYSDHSTAVCEMCGQEFVIWGTLQTSLLRHRKECTYTQ